MDGQGRNEMKCDKLTIYDGQWCDKSEVDEAIAELKAKLESVQASAYADSVDAGMRERRLRRALYKACANWAKSFKTTAEMLGAHADAVKWDNVERKCRAKVEQYR